jgi:hypothetical protein
MINEISVLPKRKAQGLLCQFCDKFEHGFSVECRAGDNASEPKTRAQNSARQNESGRRDQAAGLIPISNC